MLGLGAQHIARSSGEPLSRPQRRVVDTAVDPFLEQARVFGAVMVGLAAGWPGLAWALGLIAIVNGVLMYCSARKGQDSWGRMGSRETALVEPHGIAGLPAH